jgi:cobalt-zinc-cadmium efflux system membrane fusion protein
MHPRTPSIVAAATAQVPTLLVLVVLGGIGWWGYTHEWKIPRLTGGPEEKTDEKKTDAKPPDAGGADAPLPPVTLDSEEAADKAGITAVPAEGRQVAEYVTANGEVEFDQTSLAHLAPRAPGTVWSVEKQAALGHTVAPGTVLALVSAADVGRAKADFLQTLIQYQFRKTVLERAHSASAAIAERQVHEAEAAVQEARLRLFADQQTLLNFGFSLRLPDVLGMPDEKVVRHLRLLGLPDSVLQGRDTETLTSNLLPVTAPFEGTVVRRDAVVGETVTTATPLFTLADIRKVWIMLHVKLEDMGRLALGQEATFQAEGVREEVPSGKVAWISAEVDDKTHTLPVRIEVPNPAGRLRAHTFGTGRVLIRRRPGLTVPNDAVQRDGEDTLVFVRESPTVYHPRRVKLGLRTPDGLTEVLKGVGAGEMVVTKGSFVLKSEMQKERIAGGD